jgi:hypothetical protein
MMDVVGPPCEKADSRQHSVGLAVGPPSRAQLLDRGSHFHSQHNEGKITYSHPVICKVRQEVRLGSKARGGLGSA